MPVTIVTPIGRLSYPNLFKARPSQDGGEPKFGCALILDPDKIGPVREAILKCAQEKWGDKALEGLKHGRLHNPLRDGNQREDEAYQGKWFLSANGKNRPGIVNHMNVVVTDPDLVYPGMYVRLNLTFFTFARPEKKGVGVGLNHVQLVGAGERLDNRVSADKAFAGAPPIEGDYDTAGLAGGAPGGGSTEANPWD